MLKVFFWYWTIAGLMVPMYAALAAWRSWTLHHQKPEVGALPAFGSNALGWLDAKFGPLAMTVHPHIWAAVLIMVGSGCIVVGAFWILHVPKSW